LKRLHFPLDVILRRVCRHVAYPVSLRDLEEMIAEHGIEVDHSTVHGWVITLVPLFEKSFRQHKRPVDKDGDTVDFLFRAHRDKAAAQPYFEKAIDQNDMQETVMVDKSGSNLAALQAIKSERETPIKIRQCKYMSNIVEPDHRAIKCITKPMLGFKDFRGARMILSGIEVMHMIRKEQMQVKKGTHPSTTGSSTRWQSM
jgi:transposase-like protein